MLLTAVLADVVPVVSPGVLVEINPVVVGCTNANSYTPAVVCVVKED